MRIRPPFECIAHRPFCSPRCADIDPARWLDERYRVPAVEPDDAARAAAAEDEEEEEG